jgi:SAM-dependent methyltransferase
MSVIVSLSKGEEYKICIRCRANLRYELIAEVIRKSFPDVSKLDVLELDRKSPLRNLFLKKSKSYIRTFFSTTVPRGQRFDGGVQCEDITQLTLSDNSYDLIISSDVLEHVPKLEKAFNESYRVLRVGGAHIFTVPTRPTTRKRAMVDEKTGEVKHLVEPEYHSDPLDARGILAFWDLGFDLGKHFSQPNLEITIALGPIGIDQRVVWMAKKIR